MEHLLKTVALHCGLSQSHYWHLRLLSSICLVPLLGVLYLALFGRRARRSPPAAAPPAVSLWVNSEGRLVARPAPPAASKQEPRYS